MPAATASELSSKAAGAVRAMAMYPRTDTFVGSLSVIFHGGNPTYDSVSDPFVFYVYRANAHSLELKSSAPVQMQRDQWAPNYMDSKLVADSTGTYAAMTYVDLGSNVYTLQYTFRINGNQLSINWDAGDMPVIGVCDYEECIGQFVGQMK